MKPKVSIVIRAYNEGRFIGRLLDSIYAQEVTFSFEVILVDSGSNDDTCIIASRYPVKIHQIRPEDFSFGYSLNMGVSHSSGEYVVIISAHCYSEHRHWLAEIVKPFQNEKVGLVYGKQRGNNMTRFSEEQIFKSWFPEESYEDGHFPFCNNANAAIRRSLWEEDPYDEKLTGLEDLDWANRIIAKGWMVAYSAEAEIIHVHQETYGQIMNRYRREAIALHSLFPKDRFSILEFFKLSLLNVFSDYRQAFREKRLLSNLMEIPMFRVCQFWGAYIGYKHTPTVSNRLKQHFYYPKRVKGSASSRLPATEERAKKIPASEM